LVGCANNDSVGPQEVLEGRTFPKELRVRDHFDAFDVAPSEVSLNPVAGSNRHSALYHKHKRQLRRCDKGLIGLKQDCRIRSAVAAPWSANREEYELRTVVSKRFGATLKSGVAEHSAEFLLEARLHEWNLASRDEAEPTWF
jgi:hypothetical protein